MFDTFTAAMVDIEDAADILGISPTLARAYLTTRQDPPVATYRGRDLWLSDTVHDALEECGDVSALAEQAARDAFEFTDAELRTPGEVSI